MTAEPNILSRALAYLGRDTLGNIVLLKHIEAHGDHAVIRHIADGTREGVLVMVEASKIPYDRHAYPTALHVVLLAADDDVIAHKLLAFVPLREVVVFKLPGSESERLLFPRFDVTRTTCFLSFTSTAAFAPDADARVTLEPSEAMLRLFATEKHAASWLLPQIAAGRAFACSVGPRGGPLSVCFAFENYRDIWEIGGVVTLPEHRGRGFAKRVVRTTLAELARREKRPRYQVHESNAASIALAKSLGLHQFLALTHFLHEPGT